MLGNGYRDLIDRLDGFEVGTLVIHEEAVILEVDISGGQDRWSPRKELELSRDHLVEVWNGDHYLRLEFDEILERKTADEGWPLFGGLYARVKLK